MTVPIFPKNGPIGKPRPDPAAIAQALGDARPEGARWRATCPACGRHTFTVGLSDDGERLLVHCWGGCGQAAVIERLRARGLWGGTRGGPNPVPPPPTSPRPNDRPNGTALDGAEWWAEHTTVPWSKWELWGCRAIPGGVAFLWPSLPGGEKRRLKDGPKGLWVGSPCPPLWPELPAPPAELPDEIWLAEGESDCGVLRHAGLPAFACTKGAAGGLPGEALGELRRRGCKRVVIAFDHDEAGRQGGEKLARAAAAGLLVSVIEWDGLLRPSLGEKDVRDLFRRLGDPSLLRQALEAAVRPWTPAGSAGGAAAEAAGVDGEGALRERRWDPVPLSALGDGEGADVAWLWHGFLGRGLVTELYGFWKAGKTTLIAALLARMTPGGPDSMLAAIRDGFARNEFSASVSAGAATRTTLRWDEPGAGPGRQADNSMLAAIRDGSARNECSAPSPDTSPDTEAVELAGRRVTPGRALVVSEEPAVAWAHRRDELGLGDHVHVLARPFTKRATWEEWEAFLAHIAGLVRAHGYALVAFDSLAALWPVVDENDAGQVLRALAPLHGVAEAGCAVLLVHHPRKTDGGEATAGRGSGALAAFVDVIVEFRRADPSRPEDRRRVLSAYSRFAEPGETVIEWRGGADYATLGSRAEAERKDRWQTLAALLAEPAEPDGPATTGPVGATVDELLARWGAEAGADAVRPGRRTLAADLEAAVRAGRVVRTGAGRKGDPYRYRLARAVALVGDAGDEGTSAPPGGGPGENAFLANTIPIGARNESGGRDSAPPAAEPAEPVDGPAAEPGENAFLASTPLIAARNESVDLPGVVPAEGVEGEDGPARRPARYEMYQEALRALAAKYPPPDIPMPDIVLDDPRAVWIGSEDAAEEAWEADARRGFRRRRRRRR